MPQSLVQNYLHIIFSTKNRQPYLSNQNIRHEMYLYLSGVCRRMKSDSIIIGGVEDHIHALCILSKSLVVTDFIRDLKRESSKWIKTKGSEYADFHWQAGYGAFSISPMHVLTLRSYIENQDVHHKKETFKDEFRRILEKYNLDWDEKYVWD